MYCWVCLSVKLLYITVNKSAADFIFILFLQRFSNHNNIQNGNLFKSNKTVQFVQLYEAA